MRKFNTRAIVLKSINYKDSDKLFTLLTEKKGKITAQARGVRKISSRRGGNLDSLNLVNVKLTSSKDRFYSIEEAESLNTFKTLKSSYENIGHAYYLLELTHKALEEDENTAKIFNLLGKTLELLDESVVEPKILIPFFEINMLKYLGYMPKLSAENLSSPILHKLLKGKLRQISDEEISIIAPTLKNHIQEHLSSGFKSLEIVY
jgi:DNA repair protein RecO (recombination protein O)